ncbi:MAG: hypothetical protein ABSE25_01780 [Syntrophorhabdales bacterium]|jgi:hypothetical protein
MGGEKRGGSLFDFCDLACAYAELPKEEGIDGSGSCMTFVALFCRRKNALVHKNHPCSKKVPRSKERTGK